MLCVVLHKLASQYMFTRISHALNCCKLCINQNDLMHKQLSDYNYWRYCFHKLRFCLMLCVHCILLCVLGFRSLSPSNEMVDKGAGTTGATEAIAPLKFWSASLAPLCAHWLRDKPICFLIRHPVEVCIFIQIILFLIRHCKSNFVWNSEYLVSLNYIAICHL